LANKPIKRVKITTKRSLMVSIFDLNTYLDIALGLNLLTLKQMSFWHKFLWNHISFTISVVNWHLV